MENVMICENCGKEHDGSYGTGRFCSHECRYVFIGKHTKTHKNNLPKRKPRGNWKCTECGKIFNTRRDMYSHLHENHPHEVGVPWNKGKTKGTDNRINKYVNTCRERNHYGTRRGYNMSEEQKQKISITMKEFYGNHPELTPYKLHHSSKESYPEKYFRELLTNEGISQFKQNYPHLGYFLDFAFIEKKIDLEIDGSQHWLDKRIIEHDKIRTIKIVESGWKVIRVRWDEWQSKSDEEKHTWIENFKKIISMP